MAQTDAFYAAYCLLTEEKPLNEIDPDNCTVTELSRLLAGVPAVDNLESFHTSGAALDQLCSQQNKFTGDGYYTSAEIVFFIYAPIIEEGIEWLLCSELGIPDVSLIKFNTIRG